MVIADYTDVYGARTCRLFDSFEAFHRVTFSPDCDVHNVVELAPRGTTYRERKEHCARQAVLIRDMEHGQLTYGEIQILRDYFHRCGKRYDNMRLFQKLGVL